MNLERDSCYAALSARDRRFDGLFFVGVTTTGVYCRPVCPARLPRADRCEFYASAAAAELVGYRACLRCRPELAPGDASVDASRSVARAAARRIERGALNETSIERLADSLGVTSRHLRRTFKSELGVSPVEFAQTCRLGVAKRLLQDTTLPMTTVAHAAGFGSVRRFNAVFKDRFQRVPTDVRRRGGSDALEVRLDFRPPLRWSALLEFLSARAVPGVVSIADGTYERALRIGASHGIVRVSRASESSLHAAISLELAAHLPDVVARVRALFDLDARPDVIHDFFENDALIGARARRTPGLRVPGSMNGFETTVRTILGQQVSVAGATTLAGRFADAFGERVADRLYFPSAERIAALTAEEVREVGLPLKRATTIVDLAKSGIDLSGDCSPVVTIAALQAVRGIGPWTANYIAMRVLGWPDAYPVGDLVLDRRGGTQEHAERWRPWRAYAAMYLWHSGAP